MKNKILAVSAGLVAFFIISCGGPEGQKARVEEAKSVENKVQGVAYKVNLDKSQVQWLGSKPTGEHHGMVSLAGGELWMDENQLAGGRFEIDMTSIVNFDLEDPEYNQKLVNHLKSTDFFNADEFPKADFEITGVEIWQGEQVESGEAGEMITPTHQITGNLTIKGISKSVTFPAVVKIDDQGFSAYTPQFLVDRTDWDIKYKSTKFFDNLKDNFIDDEIGLKIILNASRQG